MRSVALIIVDAVYDRTGLQVGWWYGDHIRNRKGEVVLFVSGSKIHGLAMPTQKQLPSAACQLLRLSDLSWTIFEATKSRALTVARLQAFGVLITLCG